eukprot:3764939-Rhodomonas_salina.1
MISPDPCPTPPSPPPSLCHRTQLSGCRIRSTIVSSPPLNIPRVFSDGRPHAAGFLLVALLLPIMSVQSYMSRYSCNTTKSLMESQGVTEDQFFCAPYVNYTGFLLRPHGILVESCVFDLLAKWHRLLSPCMHNGGVSLSRHQHVSSSHKQAGSQQKSQTI